MTQPRLESREGVAIEDASIEELGSGFHGTLIGPADPGYDAARKIWNASIDRHPGLIARCSGVADVVQAVRFARAHDIPVAIRGGGHNVGGRALCDSGMVVDLSGMKAVLVDPERRTALVQAGATLGDVDRETHAYGLAVPLGVVSRTGVAGLTLGGGVGWLVRKYGLTCDNVLSFQLVTAEGELVTASAIGNPDLFWALRGGGGNFGVVTSFLYRAYPLSSVLGGLIVYRRDQAGAVLRNFRDFVATTSDELTAYAALITAPDGTPAVAVVACHCGEPAAAERELEPLRRFGTPLVDAIQRLPMPAMQKLLDDAFPNGTHNYWKSTFVTGLDDGLIDAIVEHANRARSPLTAVVLEFYGGAASRIGPSDTAFAPRQPRFDVGIMAQWTDPAEAGEHTAWARALFDAVQPRSSGGVLLNFLGEQEPPDAIRAAFGDNYPRLREVKRQYDPTNFFRINQNIQPAA